MLQAESVQMRLNSEVGVSFLEFNYMILQGYDFLHLYRPKVRSLRSCNASILILSVLSISHTAMCM